MTDYVLAMLGSKTIKTADLSRRISNYEINVPKNFKNLRLKRVQPN